jgi:hypothetical protein
VIPRRLSPRSIEIISGPTISIIDHVVEIPSSLRQDGYHLIKAFSTMKQGIYKMSDLPEIKYLALELRILL